MSRTLEGQLALRIDRRRELKPDFDFVSVGVGEENIGFAGNELANAGDLAAGLHDRLDGRLNVSWVDKPEAKMCNPAGFAGLRPVPLKHQDVAAAGCLGLNEISPSINRDYAENRLIKTQRPLGVMNRERNMRQPVCPDHCCDPNASVRDRGTHLIANWMMP
jgi:hypothetical protein